MVPPADESYAFLFVSLRRRVRWRLLVLLATCLAVVIVVALWLWALENSAFARRRPRLAAACALPACGAGWFASKFGTGAALLIAHLSGCLDRAGLADIAGFLLRYERDHADTAFGWAETYLSLL